MEGHAVVTTTWITIIQALTWCACCGKELREGDRALRVQLPSVARERPYCPACAVKVGVQWPDPTEPAASRT